MTSADTLIVHSGAAAAPVPCPEPVADPITEVKRLAEEIAEELHETEHGAVHLTGALLDALKIWPPAMVSSVLGPLRTWFPPHDRYSEFKILDLWQLRRTIRFLVNTNIPTLPIRPLPFGPPLIENLFWNPSRILQRPDHNGSYTTFPDEHWFFINGILTDDNVAQMNAAYLAYLFHRPITLIQNSTDAVLVDLLQCALGRTWHHPTEPLEVAFPNIYDALIDPHRRRVVVVCHSQGTIIMANVLDWLRKAVRQNERRDRPELRSADVLPYRPAGPMPIEPEEIPLRLEDFDLIRSEHLSKLEVYAFATCAQEMLCRDRWSSDAASNSPPPPWIEHFGNQNDIVARLGMLAPRPERWNIRIDGRRYESRGAWGHLLNAHYLTPIRKVQKSGHRKGGAGTPAPYAPIDGESYPDAVPRLYGYLNGGSPGS